MTSAVYRARTRDAALSISALMIASQRLEDTMTGVLGHLSSVAEADAGALLMLEDEQWVGRAASGAFTPAQVARMRIPFDDLVVGIRAVEEKQAVVATAAELAACRCGQRCRAKTCMAVPLLSSRTPLGVALLCDTSMQVQYIDEQLEFATMIGAQAALALDNAATHENQHHLNHSLEAIEGILEGGLVYESVEETLVELVRRARKAMQMDAVAILLPTGDGQWLEVRAATGGLRRQQGARIPVGEGITGRAFELGSPLKTDALSGRDLDACFIKHGTEVRSLLCVPLRMGDQVIGVMEIGTRNEAAFSAARDWAVIQAVADRASLAMQHFILRQNQPQDISWDALARDGHAGDELAEPSGGGH